MPWSKSFECFKNTKSITCSLERFQVTPRARGDPHATWCRDWTSPPPNAPIPHSNRLATIFSMAPSPMRCKAVLQTHRSQRISRPAKLPSRFAESDRRISINLAGIHGYSERDGIAFVAKGTTHHGLQKGKVDTCRNNTPLRTRRCPWREWRR